jgi:hypothetical protein
MMRRILAVLVMLLLCGARPAAADAGWFESGDGLMRMDLQLLNDAEVIRVPIQHWPIARATVAYALRNAKEHFAQNPAVANALARVRARMEKPRGLGLQASLAAGSAGLFRDFDTLAREDAELSGRVSYEGERFSASFNASGVASPEDGQNARADGSHATVRLGNWLVSANTLDRFWGPAHESSLILSNNARPMPTVMVERAEARAFESRWLDWIGPWRFTFGISQMESEREDIDKPLFMAWRVVVMPFRDIELGFSRTAQFCGEQLSCTLNTFGNMLAGNDNVGIDATEADEPGNQMAGFDLRWVSPIGGWPYAITFQAIGEDESSYLPAKFISQYGLEAWKPFGDGSIVQGFAEYSYTTCSYTSNSGPYFNCAYNQGRFNREGYRYRGRVIGHTSDSDAENFALGASYATEGGTVWSATARASRLNHDGFDSFNLVSAGPADYSALELGWRGRWRSESISIDLGVESLEPLGADRDVEPFGFVRWRHDFAP